MLPVNGKPVIGWILDDLLEKGQTEAVLVAQAKDQPLLDFVGWAYRGRMALRWAFMEKKGSILESLQAGLALVDSAQVALLLGDTLVPGPYPDVEDYLLVSEDFDDPRNWCLVRVGEKSMVSQFFDKQPAAPTGLSAVAGLYGFNDVGLLRQCTATAIENQERELSHALVRYAKHRPIRAVVAQRWYDFGHSPHFLKAKHELLQSRFFNQIRIESVRGVLHKSSQNAEKLADEYDWYLALPDPIQVLTPRVLGGWSEGATFHLEQEYYGYPSLAELYLFSQLDLEIWKAAVRNLLTTHQLLRRFDRPPNSADAWQMYWEKTQFRLSELTRSDAYFQSLLSLETIVLDGETLDNWPRLSGHVQACCAHLAANAECTLIHGDFCLSNILYDLQNQLVRLIDPRGRFGQKGIYGDPRYDIAKLRHSLCGGYDFVVTDLFSLEEQEAGNFQTAICRREIHHEIAAFFDQEIQSAGYNLQEIQHIEGLLFLSMLPLHRDKPARQKMMYLRAIQLLQPDGTTLLPISPERPSKKT